MKLRLIPTPAFGDGTPAYAPGDCWYARQVGDAYAWWADHDRLLEWSEIAVEHRGKRVPLIVVLPNGAPFPTTSMAGVDLRAAIRAKMAGEDDVSRFYRPGWTITGDGITITLSPSIHYDPGGDREWHGHLTGGVLA